jgi:hypothetical protein
VFVPVAEKNITTTATTSFCCGCSAETRKANGHSALLCVPHPSEGPSGGKSESDVTLTDTLAQENPILDYIRSAHSLTAHLHHVLAGTMAATPTAISRQPRDPNKRYYCEQVYTTMCIASCLLHSTCFETI